MAATTTGSLDRYPLPRLLCFLQKKRFTGVMRLETRPEAREVLLEQGVPVGLRPDTLGELLQLFAERGRIPPGTVAALQQALSRPGVDADAVLASQTGLDPEELQRGRRYVLFQALVALFREQEAAFSLTAATDAVGSDAAASSAVEPLFLVHHGILGAYDEARLRQELEPVAAQAIKAKVGIDALVERFGFGDDEARPLQYLRQGYWVLEDLLDALPGNHLAGLRVAYTLLSADALDVAPADSVPRLRPKRPDTARSTPAVQPSARASASRAQMPHPTATKHPAVATSEGPRKPPPTPPSAAQAAAPPPPVPSTAERAGVPRSTPPPTPANGHRAATPRSSPSLTGQYAKARLAPKVVQEAKATAERVRAAIGDKPDAVELLEEVVRRLEAMDGQNPFELLGVDLNATVVDVKKAYMVLVKRLHPDRLAALGLGALGSAADTLFKRLTEAHLSLSDGDKLEQARRIYQDAADGHDPDAALRAIEAEVDFQKGEVFFRKGDLAQAEQYFLSSVEGNPEEGEHRAMLAWTRYQSVARELRSQHREDIQKQMVHSLELSPRCARAHYFLGKLYLEDKRIDSALESFRMASRLKRNYIEAEREIRLIEMRQRNAKTDPGKSSFFDVFKRGKR